MHMGLDVQYFWFIYIQKKGQTHTQLHARGTIRIKSSRNVTLLPLESQTIIQRVYCRAGHCHSSLLFLSVLMFTSIRINTVGLPHDQYISSKVANVVHELILNTTFRKCLDLNNIDG